MGVEPGLEAVQGVSHHNPLRQTFPVWYISREERDLPVLCLAGGYVIAILDVLPLATFAACYSWKVATADGDEAMVELEKHFQLGFPAAVLKRWTFQRFYNGIDAQCTAVLV